MDTRIVLAPLLCALATPGCYLAHERARPDVTGPAAPATHIGVDGHLACAIGDDARVRCWGLYVGLVYSTTHEAGLSPTLVPGMDRATSIAVGTDHVCAVRDDASVWCWGFNTWGQLGLPRDDPDETDAFHAEPVRIEALPPARGVAVGWLHSCALLVDGGVACWGNDGLSELPADVPDPGFADYSAVPIFAPGLDDVVQLDAHASSTCARLGDGTLRCWGQNAFGEDGPRDGARIHAIDLAGVIDVFTGGTVSHALGADGTVFRWGAPHDTTPGDGSPSVLGHLDGAVRIVTVSSRVCAVDRVGVVVCLPAAAGAFGVRQLELLVDALRPAREVAFGFRHACLIDLAGELSCLGENGEGELGTGRRGDHGAREAQVALHDASRVVRGADFACALTGDGLHCWGGNGSGDLGVGAEIDDPRIAPERVPLDGVTRFSARAWHACAVSAGAVYCWGQNDHGEILRGGPAAIASPTRVDLPAPAYDVAVGNAHVCAATDAGVHCWGDDSRGQAGDERFLESIAPTRVVLPGDAVALAAGNAHTCAALASGDVYCWGENHEGQTGAGFCSERCLERLRAGDFEHEHVEEAPVHVVGVTGVTELRAIRHTTCGSGPSGTFCWPAGDGVIHRDASQAFLGEADVPVLCAGSPLRCPALDGRPDTEPLPLPAMDGARDLAFDSWSGCAIDGVGDVRCWGAGERGQLGASDGYSAVPLPVSW